MNAVIVRMPEASARDHLAVAAELAGGHPGMVEEADLILGVWADGSALVVKDRAAQVHGMLEGTGTLAVVNGASFHG